MKVREFLKMKIGDIKIYNKLYIEHNCYIDICECKLVERYEENGYLNYIFKYLHYEDKTFSYSISVNKSKRLDDDINLFTNFKDCLIDTLKEAKYAPEKYEIVYNKYKLPEYAELYI